MTPEEKNLIEGVFNRLAQSGVGAKDLQADALIRDRAQTNPDAAYGLVQAVIVLEAGLNHAQAQITDLRTQLAAARTGAAPAAGGFLPNAGPWGAAPAPRPGYPPAQAYPPANPWAQSAYAPSTSPVGGFLRNAATMAAGVAGGTLIAEGLSSMFGGHSFGGGFGGGGFGGGGPWGNGGGNIENVTVNNIYENGNDQTQDAGYQDAVDDGSNAGNDDWDSGSDGGFDGGFDGGSGDDGSI